MILLAIDPGFDVTGWALFEHKGDRTPATLQDALRAWVDAGEITTDTKSADPERLDILGLAFRAKVAVSEPTHIAIEMPAYSGDYGNDPKRRKGVNKLYMAIGAILANTGGVPVLEVRALTTPKETRHELLANAARMAGEVLPVGPGGGKREDAWDAVWLGCQVLMEGRVRG